MNSENNDTKSYDLKSTHELAKIVTRSSQTFNKHHYDVDKYAREITVCLKAGANPNGLCVCITKAIVKFIENDNNVSNDVDWCYRAPFLHFAVSSDDIILTCCLIQNGADVNALDSKGCTPLHVAAMYSCKKIGVLLLEHGACKNLLINCVEGNNPLHTAAYWGSKDLCEVIMTFIKQNDYKRRTIFIFILCLKRNQKQAKLPKVPKVLLRLIAELVGNIEYKLPYAFTYYNLQNAEQVNALAIVEKKLTLFLIPCYVNTKRYLDWCLEPENELVSGLEKLAISPLENKTKKKMSKKNKGACNIF